VRYDYLDSSTIDRRKALCEAEVALNRRTAPSVYRGLVAVPRERDGVLALQGTGTPVDSVVEMNRFDQDALFDRLAAGGRLDIGLMPNWGRRARVHGAMAASAALIVRNGHSAGPFAEETARQVDSEIKQLVVDAHTRAFNILRDRRSILATLAHRLIEQEVVEGAEVRALVDHVSSSDLEGSTDIGGGRAPSEAETVLT
jgi:aminoglycoside phosphotransferase family enzyme